MSLIPSSKDRGRVEGERGKERRECGGGGGGEEEGEGGRKRERRRTAVFPEDRAQAGPQEPDLRGGDFRTGCLVLSVLTCGVC